MKCPAAFLLVLAAAGCAQSTEKYPSLALRPIESRSDAETVTPVPEATPDAALDAQLATMRNKLAQIDADFMAAAVKTDAAVKIRGAQATGSDQWLAAQSLLAELEGMRGDTLGMVADLEQLITGRGEANQPPYPALDELRAKAQTQLDGEIDKIAAIKAQVGEK